jgi:thiamine biosynthesis lipoprotein
MAEIGMIFIELFIMYVNCVWMSKKSLIKGIQKVVSRIIFSGMALFMTVCLELPGTASALEEYPFSGRTMGTTYHIKIVAEKINDEAALQVQIDRCLEKINQSMSTFRPDSEISRFNALRDTHRAFSVSNDFLQVMLTGKALYRMTHGSWDGTVTPLVLLWGFGKAAPIKKLPAPEAITRARQQVGFDAIEISPRGYLKKSRADLSVDLASIAKGYGVDQMALLLKNMGYDHFLVEIGGEVFAAGRRLDGTLWRVGINRPFKGGALDAVYKVVTLKNRAMATSGDYRNYVEIDGRSYSHIIDPRTGYPVDNGVVSASVVADNCTLADGLATALMVMEAEKGVSLLNNLQDVEGLIVVQRSDGTLEDHWSKGLEPGN